MGKFVRIIAESLQLIGEVSTMPSEVQLGRLVQTCFTVRSVALVQGGDCAPVDLLSLLTGMPVNALLLCGVGWLPALQEIDSDGNGSLDPHEFLYWCVQCRQLAQLVVRGKGPWSFPAPPPPPLPIWSCPLWDPPLCSW